MMTIENQRRLGKNLQKVYGNVPFHKFSVFLPLLVDPERFNIVIYLRPR